MQQQIETELVITQAITREFEKVIFSTVLWIHDDYTEQNIAEGLAAGDYRYEYHRTNRQDEIHVIDGETIARLRVDDEDETQLEEHIQDTDFTVQEIGQGGDQ